MTRAGMAEGCSTIAGADGGRVFVHLKASPSLDAQHPSFTLTPEKEGSCDEQRLGPSRHLLSDWRRKTSTSILRHKRFFDQIGRESMSSDKRFRAQITIMWR